MVLLISVLFLPVEAHELYLKRFITVTETAYTLLNIQMLRKIVNLSIECSYEYTILFNNTGKNLSTYLNDKKFLLEKTIKNDIIQIHEVVFKMIKIIFEYYEIYNDDPDFDGRREKMRNNLISKFFNYQFLNLEVFSKMHIDIFKNLNITEKQNYKSNITEFINTGKFDETFKVYSQLKFDLLGQYLDLYLK